VRSIWEEQNLYNVFALDYIVNEFTNLEEKLRQAIEEHYNINLKKFINHIPYMTNG